MSGKQYSPSNVNDQAMQIKEAWSNIDAKATFGDLTLAEFDASLAALDAVDTTLKNLQDQVTSTRNERKAKRHALWTLVKRVRAGAKAKHGDDSDEYERFGGTRMSERKSRQT